MENKTIKARENKVRRQLARLGYQLKKSRTDGCVYRDGIFQGYHTHDRGGYMIVNIEYNCVKAGADFNLTLEDVEEFVAEALAS